MPTNTRDHSRRQLLTFLAGSPLLYGLSGTLLASAAAAQTRSETDAVLRGALEFKDIIESVDQALNVWDFEPAMRARVNAGHYAYMAQGADDFGTQLCEVLHADGIDISHVRVAGPTSGVAVILISDEIPEVLYHAHRVLVMRQGRIAGEYLPHQVSEEELGAVVNA